MYDTSLKRLKWGPISIPHDLLNECAERILAKVVVIGRPKEDAEDEARRQAEEAETTRKAMEEIRALSIPMLADVKIVSRWGEAK
jgi:hypothetical protein